MLKYLYKTLLVSILCGSILMLDFTVRGQALGVQFNQARAESVSTGGVKDANLMATLTMVGISVMTSRLVQYGKLTPDIMVAAAGGLAFMAGDMMATSKLKQAKQKIETEITRNKNGDITDEQRQSLMRLLQMYSAAKEAATTKKNLQMAAAAAFAAAAVLAYMESASEATAEATCTTALATAHTAASSAHAACLARTNATCLSTEGAVCTQPSCDLQFASCNMTLDAVTTTFPAYNALRKAPNLSCSALSSVNAERALLTSNINAVAAGCTSGPNPEFSPVPSPVASACNAVLPMHIGYESGCLSPMALYAGMGASVLLMGITASTLVTLVVSFCEPLATAIDTAIFMPMRRAIIWGVLAGLAMAASSATTSVIAELETNIKKIQSLLDTINSQSNGLKNNNAIQTSGNSVALGNIKNKDIKINGAEEDAVDLSATGAKLPCITKVKADGSCESFSNQLKSLPSVGGVGGESLGATLNNLTTMTDGLNGASKVSSATISSASALAGSANAILSNLKKNKNEMAKSLKEAGSKTNLDEEEKNVLDLINNSMNKASKSNKGAADSILASLSTNGLGDLTKKSEDDIKKLNKNAAIGIAAPKVNIGATGTTPTKMMDLTLEKEKEKQKAEEQATTEAKVDSIDQYEIKNDITTDKSENIFEVISQRYQKSGYPRLFKRLSE